MGVVLAVIFVPPGVTAAAATMVAARLPAVIRAWAEPAMAPFGRRVMSSVRCGACQAMPVAGSRTVMAASRICRRRSALSQAGSAAPCARPSRDATMGVPGAAGLGGAGVRFTWAPAIRMLRGARRPSRACPMERKVRAWSR